jgi:hypothetical protein
MRFKQVVEAVPRLRGAYRPGLQAVKGEYRERIQCNDTRRLAGSLDLDSSLQNGLPNAPRWDYGIGVRVSQHPDRCHWVEVHPATEGDVKDVLKKHDWLKTWLAQHAPGLLGMTATEQGYVWIATKAIGFRQGSPKAKQLGAVGISFPCKRFVIS